MMPVGLTLEAVTNEQSVALAVKALMQMALRSQPFPEAAEVTPQRGPLVPMAAPGRRVCTARPGLPVRR